MSVLRVLIIVTALIFMTSGIHEWPVEGSGLPQFQCQGQTLNKARP
jgi:hypothetical protein